MTQLSKNKLPRHIAIIMDGNGRWAKKRAMPRTFGHKAGVETVRDIVEYCGDLGIVALSIYAFSTENFSRPADEVSALMKLLCDYLRKDINILADRGVKLRILGDVSLFPEAVRNEINYALDKTANGDKLKLNIALGYGSRAEMVSAIKSIINDVNAHNISVDDITEEKVLDYLYTKGLPDPDLVIRTSGEQRLSNFLLYQIAYAELYFTTVAWPDFSRIEFLKALDEYANRQRRFGGV